MLIAAELGVAAWPLFAATVGGLATLGLLAGAAGWLVESSTERARMVLPLLSRRSEVRSRSSYCCSAATWEPSSFVVWLATGPILTTLALAIPANLMHEAANDGVSIVQAAGVSVGVLLLTLVLAVAYLRSRRQPD